MRRATTDYQLRLFQAVAYHALPHRRVVGQVVSPLMSYVHVASAADKGPAYFTHCKLAALRDVQHRNTSREIIRELQELGLVQTFAEHARGVNKAAQAVTWFHWRLIVHWNKVTAYAKAHGVQPTSEHAPRVSPIRTKAQYDAERVAFKAARAARVKQAEEAKARQAATERRRVGSLTPEQFRAMAKASNPFRRQQASSTPKSGQNSTLN